MGLQGIRAVYFDLDDTLCAFMETAVKARKQAFEELVQPHVEGDIEAIDRAYKKVFGAMYEAVHYEPWRSLYLKNGRPTRTETMRRMLDELGIEDCGLASLVSERYSRLRAQMLRLFEDALPTLQALKPSYRIGLITNGPAYEQREEIDVLQLEPWLDSIMIEGEVGIGKPHREIFEQALSELQVQPREAVFVGNSWTHDVVGASRVDMHAVWLNREGEPSPNQEGLPIHEIRELPELVGLLKGI
jgi:HAD superfamily hydrolase (TIGR01549 family)